MIVYPTPATDYTTTPWTDDSGVKWLFVPSGTSGKWGRYHAGPAPIVSYLGGTVHAHQLRPVQFAVPRINPTVQGSTVKILGPRSKTATLTLDAPTSVSVGSFILESRSTIFDVDSLIIRATLDSSFYDGEEFSYASLVGLPIDDPVTVTVLVGRTITLSQSLTP